MHFKISYSAWDHSNRDVETCHVTWLLTATSGALSPATAHFQIFQQWTSSVFLDSRQQHFHRCRWVWVEIHLLCLSLVKRLPNSHGPSNLHVGSLLIESVLWFFFIVPPSHSPQTHAQHTLCWICQLTSCLLIPTSKDKLSDCIPSGQNMGHKGLWINTSAVVLSQGWFWPLRTHLAIPSPQKDPLRPSQSISAPTPTLTKPLICCLLWKFNLRECNHIIQHSLHLFSFI